MDRQALHDLGGSHGAARMEGSNQDHPIDEESNFLRSTGNSRSGGTGHAGGSVAGIGVSHYRPVVPMEDLAREESFDDGPLRSSDTIPGANASWEDQSDDERARRIAQRDRRKFMDATTPTLVDEEEYEVDEEMVSLEQERLHRGDRSFFPNDESDLRRTPGAQMYKSSLDQHNLDQQGMRRTPGASQMHRSAVTQDVRHEQTIMDSSGLGFGLTLSTPVASSNRVKDARTASTSAAESALGTAHSEGDTQVSRPPLGPNGPSREQRGTFLVPWTLSQNAYLEGSRGRVYSPNTLRLTEDLGNLLLDDDTMEESTRQQGQAYFREEAEESALSQNRGYSKAEDESWTDPYVVSIDTPSRVPRGSGGGRNRRWKSDSSRRARPSPGPRPVQDQTSADDAGFLPGTQQPKPVRRVDPLSGFDNQFVFGDIGKASSGVYAAAEEEEDRSSPRLLNFGGAFAPPSKGIGYGSNFRRPVPSTAVDSKSRPFPPAKQDVNRQGTFPGSNMGFGTGFHNPFQPPTQSFGSDSSKFQQFPTQEPMFSGTANLSQTPNFGFQAPNVDPYGGFHAGSLHPPAPQEFMANVPVHPHQRPPMPQFNTQAWPQTLPLHYDAPAVGQTNWHGQLSGWPVGEYGYGVQQQGHSEGRVAASPSPAWPEMEHVPPPEMSSNPFEMLPPAGVQPMPAATLRTSRNPSRAKNQRKGTSRRGARNQSSTDRGQKIEAPSTQAFAAKKAPPTGAKNKKKQAKDRSNTPSTTNPTQNISDEATTADVTADAKRAELIESPATRAAFKDFYRRFRAEERSSFQQAEAFALQALAEGQVPASVHWRVYLELADLAKRANRFSEARKLYQQVCRLQPYANQGWLEYSKLEEECGNMDICAKILRAGLGYCEYSENLLTRAIKNEEKMGKLGRARELLARLKHVGIEKVWRTVLEGALLEARAGNDVMARRVLKYLMHHVPWYGPLYLEAYRLERDLGRPAEALAIVERGLSAIPRYGPLWFGAFRLCEAMDHARKAYSLPQSMAMIDRATFSISKELIWKVHLEAAQMLERASIEHLNDTTEPTLEFIMSVCRKRFAMTILTCPPNLRWKVWLASGRMEVAAGKADTARKLFLRAHQVVPDKGRAVALLECARLEEFVGDNYLASAILCKSRTVSGSDWKVWLESVLLEIRGGNHSRAIELAKLALQTHSGTGRLWASLVQLRHYDGGEEEQFRSLKRALNAVPKSGEVWCEGARIHLNPYCRTFDVSSARRHLFFATKFTPQYGDGFLETLRLEILEQWLLPIAKIVWDATESFLPADCVACEEGVFLSYIFGVARSIFAVCRGEEGDERIADSVVIDKEIASTIREQLEPGVLGEILDVSGLRLRCANADPNYGSLWFHCRVGPTDTARNVLVRALELMVVEMRTHAHIYILALIRRFAVLKVFEGQTSSRDSGDNEAAEKGSARWEELVNETLLGAPSMQALINAGNEKYTGQTGMDLLKSTMTGSDFVTGLVALSKHRPMEQMTVSERRKALFGTDALFS